MQVVIPRWANKVLKSKSTKPKYWEVKDLSKLPKKHKDKIIIGRHINVFGQKAYIVDVNGDRFLKNTVKVGKPNYWILNGQDLYSAVLNWRLRKGIALYYHGYFSSYIKEQIKSPLITENEKGIYALSISCDIYEIKRGLMPDVSNMWLLEKFFEDSLQECNVIPDDNPDYVIESGRKRYHWVETEQERKLIFNINKIKL